VATALVIGSSSGIGRALCVRLLDAGWTVLGVARREGLVRPGYTHLLGDVGSPGYRAILMTALVGRTIDACVYAAGIGHELDGATLAGEAEVFATNLVGAAITAEVVVPAMVARGVGHFVGLSSQADRLISAEAPSYAASKAGMSAFLEGLAYALRPRGVAVSNVRFGFVDTTGGLVPRPTGEAGGVPTPHHHASRGDTEMARAQVRPFLITADRAARVIEGVLVRRPVRRTYPRRMAVVIWMIATAQRIRGWFA
jgi:NAD(P)-dependent dehydrogenase (short-subunit alcohol dehydrogenase family)